MRESRRLFPQIRPTRRAAQTRLGQRVPQGPSEQGDVVRRLTCVISVVLSIGHLIPVQAAERAAHLDAKALLSETQPGGLIDNGAFVPGPDALPAHAPFTGSLVLTEAPMRTSPADLKFRAVRGKDPHYFPAARLSFITVDGDLVPTSQDVIRSGFAAGRRSYWDMIVQPGRTWSVRADGEWSRAAFPFALVNSMEGETHNGLATFLYRNGQVSALRYQIVQQTLPGNVEAIFTAFGRAPVRFDETVEGNPDEAARRYRAAEADSVPVRPWSELLKHADKGAVAGFADGVPAKDTVLSGLDFRGTFYLHDCNSAVGPLPWCERARFGVWSVTKAFANEVALLRLAQKYGPDVFKAKITDYVPEARGQTAWSNVRFDDCINMASGVGNGSSRREPNDISDGYLEPTYYEWYDAPSWKEKILALLRTGRAYPWGPGQVARYRDQDMFILAVAMDAYLKSREGPHASLWKMLEHEVYEPIGIHYAPVNLTVESSGEGQPIMGFGAYPTIGDLVKVARLYHARGSWGGAQLLYAPRIDELSPGPRPRGLPTGDRSAFGETTYFNTFWNLRYDSVEGCKLYIPQMLGWGANSVTLYPGGATAVRIAHLSSDAAVGEDPLPMARAVNRLAPFCNARDDAATNHSIVEKDR